MAKFSRRAALAGLGASVAVPFLPSWRGDSGYGVLSRAKAADDAPKRMVVWFGTFGTLPQYWTPGTGADGEWELSEILAPLAPFKSQMNVLTGVNMVSHMHSRGGSREGSTHSTGAAHMLGCGGETRVHPWGGGDDGVNVATNATFDHVVVDLLPTRPSRRFGALVIGDTSDHPDSFSLLPGTGIGGSGMPETLRWPGQVYDTLFSSFEGSDTEREARRAGRLSALNGINASFRHLYDRVNAEDKRVLDRHLQSLVEIEGRLGDRSYCVPPERPTLTSDTVGGQHHWPDPNGPYRDMFQLAATALLCGQLDVASIRFEGRFADLRTVIAPAWSEFADGENSHGDMHAYAHQTWHNHNGTQLWKAAQIWRMQVFAEFLQTLQNITEENGRTALDNTIVVHVSEIMTGLHDAIPHQPWGYSQRDPCCGPNDETMYPKGLPIFTVGGGGAGLTTGAHHDLTGDAYYEHTGKYSLNELYLTIARALGIDRAALPTFGTPELCNRLIGELLPSDSRAEF